MFEVRVVVCLFIAFTDIVYADNMQGIIFRTVRDFASDSLEKEAAGRKIRKGIVPFSKEMRMAMFNRRKGLYVNTPEDDPRALPFIKGIRPVRSYIEIKEPDHVSLFFEDAAGKLVSCRKLMRGMLTDCCLYWGDPECGVLAWYGVVENAMAVLVSPGVKAIPLHYVRTEALKGDRKVSFVDDGELLAGISGVGKDPIDAVYKEVEERVLAKRLRTMDFAARGERIGTHQKTVYYVMELGTRQINWLTNWNGGGWTHLYMRLGDDGVMRYVLAADGKRFEQWGIGDPEKEWWDWLRPGRDRYRYTDGTWILSDDTITELFSPVMLVSLRMDDCITVSESASVNDKMKRHFANLMESVIPHPKRWFSTKVFKRLNPTPENGELRRSIDDAPWVGSALVPNHFEWFEKE